MKSNMKRKGYESAASQILKGGGMHYSDDEDSAEDEFDPFSEMEPMYFSEGGMVDAEQSEDESEEPSKHDEEMEFTRVLRRRGYR